MLSKNQVKLISSLHQKKYRNKHGLFIAEGVKIVNEFLQADINCHLLIATDEFQIADQNATVIRVSEAELKKLSHLKTPNKVLGVFKIPDQKPLKKEGLIVALDGINDPGNLGTIIRLCDWFGIEQLVCSANTVDCYNAKVVQATMGSLARVQVSYADLSELLSDAEIPVYGAVLDGADIHEEKLVDTGILVLGSEANGLSVEVDQLISRRITIPRFGDSQDIESLNVATATAILLHEFRRQSLLKGKI